MINSVTALHRRLPFSLTGLHFSYFWFLSRFCLKIWMMETLLEQQRRYHEERERLSDSMVKELLHTKKTVNKLLIYLLYYSSSLLLDLNGPSSGERFANHGDIFDCRGSSVLVDCIFVLVRIWFSRQLSGNINGLGQHDFILESVDRGLTLAHIM